PPPLPPPQSPWPPSTLPVPLSTVPCAPLPMRKFWPGTPQPVPGPPAGARAFQLVVVPNIDTRSPERHNGWMRRASVLFLVSCAARSTVRPDVARIGDVTDRGGLGLWVDSQEGSFANLEIRPAS